MLSFQTQLSLAKLCAMVTMKKPSETSIQSFSLPLTSLVAADDQTERDPEAVEKVLSYISFLCVCMYISARHYYVCVFCCLSISH